MMFGWLIILLVVYMVVRQNRDLNFGCGHSNNQNQIGKTALDTLKERYAKSEITTEEYVQMKDTLLKN